MKKTNKLVIAISTPAEVLPISGPSMLAQLETDEWLGARKQIKDKSKL